ncbi:MAG TPA: HlyD family efflux transporter periplasmic adaptor subunit, partial [Hyphomicrobium sp.]|nr:HlyD family efflux transporter periplasmic adaptor subunit [Hyphomicrobium sp.]
MSSPLFRSQVAAARRNAWLGDAQLVQPLPLRIVTLVCLMLMLSAIAYSVLGAYTRRVHALGILTPDVGLITVASPVAGRVSSSGAKEGDHVAKGQLLYTIDLDAVSASGPTQKRVIQELSRQKDSIIKQRALRASTAADEKSALEEQAQNLAAQSKQLDEQIKLQDELLPPLKQRVETLTKAVTDGIARSGDLQTQNYLYMQAAAQLAQFDQASLQIKGKMADVKAKLTTFDSKLAQDLAEMDRSSAQLEQQIAESEAKQGIEIRAPEKGVLTSIRVQAGQSVAPGAVLLTLLPSDGRLQANLFVDSSAIGFVEKGAVVMLRYAAFPFQRFGLYRGVVTEVTRAPVESGDALDASGLKDSDKARGGVYRIVVRPDRKTVTAYGEERALEAGMRVEADIALEKRPLYRWLFDPLY